MAELFGFSIKDRKKKAKVYSPAPPDSDDGTSAVAAGAYFGQYLDLDGVGRHNNDFEFNCSSRFEEVVNKYSYMWKNEGEYSKKG